MKFFLRACCFAGITGTALFLTWNTVLLPAKQQRQEAVLQVLNTLSAEFLVLETEKVMADIRVHTGNLLLGPRSGTARVILNIHRGVDVDRLHAQHLRVWGSRVTVTLPPVQVLDITPRLNSLRCDMRRSGLQALADLAAKRSVREELLKSLQGHIDTLRHQDASSRRPALLNRLNARSRVLFHGTGLTVRFE